MDHAVERFASDGVFHAQPQTKGAKLTNAHPSARPDRAEVLERLVNPRGLGVAPARLVAVIDAAVQEALDETPLVLWEAEEIIRFELPDARILLILSEGDQPGQIGLTLGVVFEGENCHEIAPALARLIARTLCQRYPQYETTDQLGAFAQDMVIDQEVDALLAEPLVGTQGGLPPIETLVDQMWRRADACAPQPVVSLPALVRLSFWQRLARAMSPPALAPMRQSVRVLALLLFAMGLVQGGNGISAQAETQADTAP